jgi:hypothetical protein
MLHFSGLALGAGVKKPLDTLPALAGHKRFMSPLVCASVPVELAYVQALALNLVGCALVKLPALESNAFGAELRHE